MTPRPFTLRVLLWMAAGAWDRTAAGMTATLAAWGNKPPSPAKLNPFRQNQPKSAVARANENREGWDMLHAWVKQQRGGR